MRKTISAIFLIIAAAGHMQAQTALPIDSITKKVTYTAIVSATANKDLLYSRALQWFAVSFKSSNDVIQLKDKDLGKIVGKFTIPLWGRFGYAECTAIVQVKDSKYKYTFTDFAFTGNGEFKHWAFEDDPSIWSVNMTKSQQNKVRMTSDQAMMEMILSLNNAMASDKADGF